MRDLLRNSKLPVVQITKSNKNEYKASMFASIHVCICMGLHNT